MQLTLRVEASFELEGSTHATDLWWFSNICWPGKWQTLTLPSVPVPSHYNLSIYRCWEGQFVFSEWIRNCFKSSTYMHASGITTAHFCAMCCLPRHLNWKTRCGPRARWTLTFVKSFQAFVYVRSTGTAFRLQYLCISAIGRELAFAEFSCC